MTELLDNLLVSNGWLEELDEREAKEVVLARLYADQLAHGTTGHLRLMVIAKLAALLDGFEVPLPPIEEEDRKILSVPYNSQWEGDARAFRKDCGPACVEMVGEYLRPGRNATTDEIMRSITGGSDRSTSVTEITQALLEIYSIEVTRVDPARIDMLRPWIDEGRPPICLVHYGSFKARMDWNYTSGHYMVVVGYDTIDYQGRPIDRVIVHDPDWFGPETLTQGAFFPIPVTHWQKMWQDASLDWGNPPYLALVPTVL